MRCEICDQPLDLSGATWPPVCAHCGRDHWRLAGEVLTRGDVRTARALVRATATDDPERARSLHTELLQRVLEAIAAHRTEDNPCDVASLATALVVAPFDRAHVGEWMRRRVRDFADGQTGEVQLGALAEAAADAFDLADEGGPLDETDHWIWDVARETADTYAGRS